MLTTTYPLSHQHLKGKQLKLKFNEDLVFRSFSFSRVLKKRSNFFKGDS